MNEARVMDCRNVIETKAGETNHRFPACLLLTATINPKNTPGVARPSAADRENDYAKALEFYLKTRPD